MVWLVLPGGLRVAPLDLSSWSRVLTDWRLLTVLMVTMLSMSGQFTLFTYIAPLLTQVYGLAPNAIALALLLGGSAGVLGSVLATRLAASLGLERSIMLSLGAVAFGLGLIWLGWGQLWALVAGVLLWNLGGFPANSLQQGRLVALAPPLASATVALNTSFVYLGQSLGSATGGRLVADGPNPAMPLAATGFVLVSMLLSRLATRRA
jgi:predicted MFS family arabinose efflux permease